MLFPIKFNAATTTLRSDDALTEVHEQPVRDHAYRNLVVDEQYLPGSRGLEIDRGQPANRLTGVVLCRQKDAESGTLTRRRVDTEPSTMRPHDPERCGEPHSATR